MKWHTELHDNMSVKSTLTVIIL